MFYNHLRSILWTEGETCNNFININDYDCDHNSVCSKLFVVVRPFNLITTVICLICAKEKQTLGLVQN